MRFGNSFTSLAFCLVACSVLSGCGGGGSSGGPGSTPPVEISGNFFPTNANGRWVYASSATSATNTTTVSGTQTVAGQLGTVFHTVYGDDGSVSDDIYVVSATGVKDFAPVAADPISQALSGLIVLPFPVVAG